MILSKSASSSVDFSIDDLQGIWARISEQYFDNRLPSIHIEWSTRLTASTGMFASQVSPRSQRVSIEERHGSARCIRLSAPLLQNQSKEEIIRTLAHEMIHQWQYDVKKRWPNHGPDFHEVMARMNRDGLGITVRHSLNEQVDKLTKYAWLCKDCGMTYRRHRRTISPTRHRCGRCHGNLHEAPIDMSDLDSTHIRKPFPSESPRHPNFPSSREDVKPQQLAFNF